MRYFPPAGGLDSLLARKPAVAGSFYPSGKADLQKAVRTAFAQAIPGKETNHIRALVVPHAGYVFSGTVAASAFNQLNPAVPYKRVFIIGSSHRASFSGASVYCHGNYQTPLGVVNVDNEVGMQLHHENPGIFSDSPEFQAAEHSLEVQLPFLQEVYGKQLLIVPVLIGSSQYKDCYKIADCLRKWFTPENLFVISTDFSHYPSYRDATKVDAETAEALCSNSIGDFIDILSVHDKALIPGLSTSICGWTSVLVLLHLSANSKELQYNHLQYKNSGDSPYGDHDRVVGYHAISLVQKETAQSVRPSDEKKKDGFSFTRQEKEQAVQLARQTLTQYVEKKKLSIPDTAHLDRMLKESLGVFVSLKKAGKLRGCIGQFNPRDPLWKLIQDMTVASCSRDTRFEPVNSEELNQIDIEISVLSPLRKITDPSEIILGKHGIYMRQGRSSGTFLPQVAAETGWTLEEFLGHCSRDKAGLGWDGWKSAELFIYEALIIEEHK